jgi:hypothetical protein
MTKTSASWWKWKRMPLLNDRGSLHGAVQLLALPLCILLGSIAGAAQDDLAAHTTAGYVPVISGAFAYIQNTSGGVQSLVPQIVPLLLAPMGHSLLLESRVEFTGFFQRESSPSGAFSGRFAGKVYKTVDYAQLDWLADSHATVVAGRFILPFGLYSERLAPVWIRNLQDMPLTYSIGTHPYGAADGVMLRGVAASLPSASIQYSAFISAHCSTDELQAVRAAGGDTSIFVPSKRVEVGLSYQRTLEGYQINNEAAYLSWQPQRASVDLKAEYDRNHFGDGYWIEAAHIPQQFPVAPNVFRHVQLVGRMEQFFVRNGGGNGLARVNEKRPEAGLNFQIRDDWKLEASYGRLFSQSGNSNTWNFGFTYRFIWPLWPGRKS